MVFPATELPIFVDIAPGASPMGTTDSWDPFWVDITKDVRVGQSIVVEEGIPDEANQADPGSCSLTLNMGASKVPATLGQFGCYSTRNPVGPYWGGLAKNTPLRVRLQRFRDTFARTATPLGMSDSGNSWSNVGTLWSADGSGKATAAIAPNSSTTNSPLNAGSWDFDMTFKHGLNVLPTNVANADVLGLVNFRRNGTTSFYQLYVWWKPDGTVTLFINRTINGAQTTLASATMATALGTILPNTLYSFRIKAEGGFIGAKMWLGAQPAAYNITAVDTTYNLDNSNLGTSIQFNPQRLSGNVGTTAIYYSDMTISTYPFIGAVPEWPVRWDQSGNDTTAPLKATGVLRRLQQGKSPIKSPLYSFMDGLNPAALWTLEDDSGATGISSQTPNVKAGTYFSSTPGGWDGPPKLGGTKSQYTVAVDTTLAFTFPKMIIVDRWLSWFTFYMPVLPVAGADALVYRIRSAGTIVQWDVKVSQSFGGVIFLQGFDAAGAIQFNFSLNYTPGTWVLGQVEIQATGTTMTGRLVTYNFGTGAVFGSTGAAITGKIGAPNAASFYGSTGYQDGAVGPIAVYPTIPSVNIANLQASGNGFLGEDAGTRSARLAAEKNIRLDLVSGGRSSAMGVQTSDTFLNTMGENAVTDIGLLTEFRGGLRYRTRGRRYNQSPRMALDFLAGHIKRPPEPTDDDQRLRNDITVSNKNGGSARAYDSGSINTNGLYDTETDVNTAKDDDLDGQVGFRLYLGTWDEMRWPSITLDLARNAGVTNYIERATALDAGAYVTLANPPSNLPVGTLDLLVEGTKTTFGPFEWTIELVCQPYGPWRITDSSNTTTRIPRMDLVGSTLNSAEAALAVGATDTWTLLNTGRNWDSTEVPFNLEANGEVVTVTALSGSGSQSATVTRGVNGITKAHVVGEPVSLADPLYVAL